jgi:hypothetical protein
MILGKWTARLWQEVELPEDNFYVDGHHKPVYTEQLIPRGLDAAHGQNSGVSCASSSYMTSRVIHDWL